MKSNLKLPVDRLVTCSQQKLTFSLHDLMTVTIKMKQLIQINHLYELKLNIYSFHLQITRPESNGE